MKVSASCSSTAEAPISQATYFPCLLRRFPLTASHRPTVSFGDWSECFPPCASNKQYPLCPFRSATVLYTRRDASSAMLVGSRGRPILRLRPQIFSCTVRMAWFHSSTDKSSIGTIAIRRISLSSAEHRKRREDMYLRFTPTSGDGAHLVKSSGRRTLSRVHEFHKRSEWSL